MATNFTTLHQDLQKIRSVSTSVDKQKSSDTKHEDPNVTQQHSCTIMGEQEPDLPVYEKESELNKSLAEILKLQNKPEDGRITEGSVNETSHLPTIFKDQTSQKSSDTKPEDSNFTQQQRYTIMDKQADLPADEKERESNNFFAETLEQQTEHARISKGSARTFGDSSFQNLAELGTKEKHNSSASRQSTGNNELSVVYRTPEDHGRITEDHVSWKYRSKDKTDIDRIFTEGVYGGFILDRYKNDFIIKQGLYSKDFCFVKIEEVGKGDSGTVHKCQDLTTQKEFVIKTLKNPHKDHLAAEREVKSLFECDHDNIMKFYGLMIDKTGFHILLEYCGTSLGDYLHEQKSALPRPDLIVTVKEILIQLLKALEHIHKEGIVHGDIHIENVLINEKGELKLIDFGSAKRIGDKPFILSMFSLILPPEHLPDYQNYRASCKEYPAAEKILEKQIWSDMNLDRVNRHNQGIQRMFRTFACSLTCSLVEQGARQEILITNQKRLHAEIREILKKGTKDYEAAAEKQKELREEQGKLIINLNNIENELKHTYIENTYEWLNIQKIIKGHRTIQEEHAGIQDDEAKILKKMTEQEELHSQLAEVIQRYERVENITVERRFDMYAAGKLGIQLLIETKEFEEHTEDYLCGLIPENVKEDDPDLYDLLQYLITFKSEPPTLPK